MSELALFSFGAILFLMTTWATIAFGVRRMHELRYSDLAASDQQVEAQDRLTEIYVPKPTTPGQ